MTLTLDECFPHASTSVWDVPRMSLGSLSQVDGEGVGWKVYRGGYDYNEAVPVIITEPLFAVGGGGGC